VTVGNWDIPEWNAEQDANQKWWCLIDAPMWQFVPAVWPHSKRRWLDPRSKLDDVVVPKSNTFTINCEFLEMLLAFTNGGLDSVQFSPMPSVRYWLLAGNDSSFDLDVFLRSIMDDAKAREIEIGMFPEFVQFATEVIRATIAE
jgi:hypothetical protein